MNEEVKIIITDDDEGHTQLVKRNLRKAGIVNDIITFDDGEQLLDFLFQRGDGSKRESPMQYLLILDIRMPRLDGVEALKIIKEDDELKKIPAIMLTTTDDPYEVDLCHSIGCSNYITKPIDYEEFVEAIKKLGLFLSIVRIPIIDGVDGKN